MSALSDLSFDFTELFALKKVALQLVDEANFYKTGTERNEATISQLLKEKLEMQLQMESMMEAKGVAKTSTESFLDNEKPLLLKHIAILEESNKQQKNVAQELQAQLQAMKRDLKNSELLRFQLEAQLSDAKSRLELEFNSRKAITEQAATATRILQELRNNQAKLSTAIATNESEVNEACSIYRQLAMRNKFLENALGKSEESIAALRKRSLLFSSISEDSHTGKIVPFMTESKADERLNILEGKCSKLQQELSAERKKSLDLLDSLSSASTLNEQLALAKETGETELKKQLAAFTEELEKIKGQGQPKDAS